MQKYLKEKPKPKKSNNQNKLKKVLYPSNSKPITFEMNTGKNNQKYTKKRLNNNNKKIRNDTMSPTSRNTKKDNNSKNTKQTNKSLNNNNILELDYLNFSNIDLGLRKLNSSFDEDLFGSNIFKEEKNKIASNRYNGIDSSTDTIKTDTHNNNYIEESKENLLKTPSTLCNYYDISEAASSKKKGNNENNSNKKDELRKNLDKIYENSKNNNDIKYISVNTKPQNVVNWKLKDSIKITKNKSSALNIKKNKKNEKEKEFSNTLNNNSNNKNQNKYNKKQNNSKNKQNEKIEKNEVQFKNNLMENYLNSKISKRKGSFNMSSSKKNNYDNKMSNVPKEFVSKTLKYTNNSSTKSIHYQNNTTGLYYNNLNYTNNTTKNINSLMKNNFNKTITGILMNINNSNLSNTGFNIENKKTNNTTNGIYYNSIHNGSNYKKGKHSGQQKPTILCYNKMKYDSYFVTPKNNNKIIKGKVQTSNKSTKLDSNSGGVGVVTGSINNNVKKANYNIIVNTLSKGKNKSLNKNQMENNIIYHNYNSTNNKLVKNNYINNETNGKEKINLKNHNKSSSLLCKPKGNVCKNIDSNSNFNKILKLLNSGGKENSLLKNLLKKVSNSKSPLKKYKSSNTLKISKTLTEQNILNRMQATPKYYKIPKSGNAYTTIVKKNKYINSNEKNATENLKSIKYNNSSIKKNYQFVRSNNNYNDILNNLFKHKTQSDFKANKYYIINNSNINSDNAKSNNNNENRYLINNDYGMDKHVKQKLLDRMNNATNNWQFIFRGNNSNNNNDKKVLIDNLSEIMKSPEKKDIINNNTIISNESDDENDKKENINKKSKK